MNAHHEHQLQRIVAACPVAGRISRGDLYDLVRAIETVIAERPSPDHLWPMRRVASYLGLAEDEARQVLSAPGAPAPFGDPESPHYRAADLYQWLDTQGRARLRAV